VGTYGISLEQEICSQREFHPLGEADPLAHAFAAAQTADRGFMKTLIYQIFNNSALFLGKLM
jgi:hypothetical protein